MYPKKLSTKKTEEKFIFYWRPEGHWSVSERYGSGSVPECHGSGTLLQTRPFWQLFDVLWRICNCNKIRLSPSLKKQTRQDAIRLKHRWWFHHCDIVGHTGNVKKMRTTVHGVGQLHKFCEITFLYGTHSLSKTNLSRLERYETAHRLVSWLSVLP